MTVKHLPGRHNQDDHGHGGGIGAALSALDKLGLADRIKLGPGEELAGSGKARTSSSSDTTMVMAMLHSPAGHELRLGIVADEDSRRWSAGNRGGTVKLDEPATDRFLSKLEAVAARAKEWSSGQDEPDWDSEAVIADGVIPGSAWGDIAYRAEGVDDGSGGWQVRLAVRPPDARADWDIFDDTDGETANFGPREIRSLRTQVNAMRDHADGKSSAPSAPIRRDTMEIKSFLPKVKALDETTGTATFVIATLNQVDSDGDVTLPGFFGKQHAQMVPAHDWEHVPIGKGLVYEQGDLVLAEVKFNLDIPAAKAWHSAIRFDFDNPPALQEYSYGYTVRPGGSEPGDFKGRRVRYLKALPDGTPGVDVHEVSPTLLGAGVGTRTAEVKSHSRFADEAQAVVAAVRALSDRAADVMAKRLEKGKALGADSSALIAQVKAELKRLDDLLATPAEPDQGEIEREFLRFAARTR